LRVTCGLREAQGGAQQQTDPGERNGSLYAHDTS
jgi:hypothetical protein